MLPGCHISANDPATQYAADVVGCRIVAGKLVRLACERHLRDLETGAARGLWFDTEEAAEAIRFWQLCPHIKGRHAKRGELLKLEPWQAFIIGSVYGWKREDGTRRFRLAWVELARKNGKTTLAYPALLHGTGIDGEAGAECYAVATKRDQARIVFELASTAVSRTPDLGALFVRYAFSIIEPESGSKCEPISADAHTLDGLNPSVVVCDEIHKWRGRALWDVIETGVGAREQPLIIAITTAGEEGEADVYGQEHAVCLDVLHGLIEDDTRFSYIACLDPGDDIEDERNYVKANPNLGVSVQAEEIKAQVVKALRSPAALNGVKRLRLGIRSQDADSWIPLELWDSGRDDRVSWQALRGYPCFGGLDLASSADFAALALTFPLAEDWTPAADLANPALWAYLFRFWIPREGRSHRETKLRELIQPWVDAGEVQATDGDGIDHNVIAADIIGGAHIFTGPPDPCIADLFDIRGLAFDPFNATQLSQQLASEGLPVVKFEQNLRTFAEPTKLFETDLLNRTIRHGGNPCARWMAANVVAVQNGAGHRMPSRKKSRNKIDGIVAAVMARGRAMAGGTGGPSFYDTHGVEAF